jgi:acyl-CoA reductase-like NAD-dependent aldehyde dehydrogenase
MADAKYDRDKLYIGGEWVASTGDETVDVVNATTEVVMGRIPRGTAEDVDHAVTAAAAAFTTWSRLAPAARAAFLEKIADGLKARAQEIATVIAQEMGMPVNLAARIQVGLPTTTFASMPRLLEELPAKERVDNSVIVREPIGVVGCITPWNYPLHQIAAKVAPALAAGCTVVLKPSEVAPINAFLLAEIIHAAGLPAGVFNLVSGRGSVVGEAIVSHPAVDMISFTGSTVAGRRVSELAAGTVKRVALELGGKSPNIILEDADFEKAITDGVAKCFLNSGQTCSALTRMLVPQERLVEAEEIAARAAATYTAGDPLVKGTRLGPLVSAEQRDMVRRYIEKGIEEGAKLVAGGVEPPDGVQKGYFVRATVFSDVKSTMTIAQEEIFGPVLAIMPYETEEEAIRIANDSMYGLAGGVWSGDPEHAQQVALRIRTGQVEINGGAFNPLAPFGGYKQSGHGRELGKYGLEEFFQLKALQLPAAPAEPRTQTQEAAGVSGGARP